MNVTVRNVITSMRLISAVDWAEIFESVSLVDAVLRADSDFAEMDFPTRDRYRHAIEELARGSARSELDVARRAIHAARRARDEPQDAGDVSRTASTIPATTSSRRPPGLREGASGFACRSRRDGSRARTPPSGSSAISGRSRSSPRSSSPCALSGVSELGAAGGLSASLRCSRWSRRRTLAVALVNRGVTNRFGATILPALELRDGVPANLRTMVVVPTLLTTRAAIEEQIERLEVHYLASPDGDLRFALLSDWTDSATETAPGDDALLGAAVDGIAQLNRRYGPAPDGRALPPAPSPAHLERGAGQVDRLGTQAREAARAESPAARRDRHDLPADRRPSSRRALRRPLRDHARRRHAAAAGRRQAAGREDGASAQPSAASILRTGRVVEGYAVLQPRVTPSLPTGREGSLFQRVFSSPERPGSLRLRRLRRLPGSVRRRLVHRQGHLRRRLFEAALDGRIPENTLLSHDLLEGIFARAGLVSDIEVVEEFPSRYDVAAARQHRWARGDWQLLPWILGRGRRSEAATATHSAIPLIGRWKMLDNLRRSLSAPAAVLALLAGWTLPFAAAPVWSGFVLATFALPALLPCSAGIVPRRLGISQRRHWRAVGADLVLALSQIALLVTFLAHQAWLMTDAIARTLFRLFVSRRRLLEWVTAAQAKVGPRLDLRGFYRRMAGGVALAAGAAIVVAWAEAGCVADRSAVPDPVDAVAGRRAMGEPAAAASRFITPISDADAQVAAAHRTPHVALLRDVRHGGRSHASAGQLSGRSEAGRRPSDISHEHRPLSAVGRRRPRFRLAGHARDRGAAGGDARDDERPRALPRPFLQLVRHARPASAGAEILSSVDSGNLAGHLIALGNACREMIGEPVIGAELGSPGSTTGCTLTRESCATLADDRRTHTVTRSIWSDALDALSASLSARPSTTPAGIARQLARADAPRRHGSPISRERLAEERGRRRQR